MADSAHMFIEKAHPFYKRKRFNFVVGITIGLIGMYAASTTPVAQNLNTIQDYLLLQLGDIDLANILPQSELVDEFLGNFTNFLKPTPPTEMSFMPALEYKYSKISIYACMYQCWINVFYGFMQRRDGFEASFSCGHDSRYCVIGS